MSKLTTQEQKEFADYSSLLKNHPSTYRVIKTYACPSYNVDYEATDYDTLKDALLDKGKVIERFYKQPFCVNSVRIFDWIVGKGWVPSSEC